MNRRPSLAGGRHPSHSGRILLVDDDPGVRASLHNVLAGEGYEVIPAADGVQAVELAAQREPHLVLLDLNMPGRDGWDTLECLVREHPTLPIALITARPNQLFPALAASVGALLEKPLDIPQLLEVVRRLLTEPPKVRRARLAGRKTDFYHQPPHSGTP